MPFRRRRKPLHEQLAEGTGLLEWRPKQEPPAGFFTGTLDVLHGGRPRRWDAVVAVEAPTLTGDAVHFAALPDGTLIVDEAVPSGSLEPVAAALDDRLKAPYRAEGVRRGGAVWAVAANRIDVVELPGVLGERIELSVHGGERTLVIDGEASWEAIPALEAFATERHQDFVARAERLDGDLWQFEIAAL